MPAVGPLAETYCMTVCWSNPGLSLLIYEIFFSVNENCHSRNVKPIILFYLLYLELCHQQSSPKHKENTRIT